MVMYFNKRRENRKLMNPLEGIVPHFTQTNFGSREHDATVYTRDVSKIIFQYRLLVLYNWCEKQLTFGRYFWSPWKRNVIWHQKRFSCIQNCHMPYSSFEIQICMHSCTGIKRKDTGFPQPLTNYFLWPLRIFQSFIITW